MSYLFAHANSTPHSHLELAYS